MLAIPPIIAEPIFNIGSFAVTNAYINSTVAVLFFVIVGLIMRNKTATIPGKLQNFAESLVEFMLDFVDRVTGDRKKSLKFLPIVGSLFLFILISNWMGLLPGTGSIGRWLIHDGHLELVPLLRPANADLNMTLAMAIFSVLFAHVVGVMTIGFFKYANKFIKIGDLIHAFKKGGVNILVGIVEFGVGLIELSSEVAKMLSLSLRLFGNIFAGEVLLTVMVGLVAYAVPLPFMFLELLVGLIQALVFSMLVLVYLVMATMPVHGEQHAGAH